MTALAQLNAYLERLERRLRILAAIRGTAILTVVSVVLTVVLAWVCNRFAFASNVVLPVRVLLYLAVAFVLAVAIVLPLVRLTRRSVAKQAEEQMPDFHQRLITLTERDIENPFAELLAEDAMEVSRRHPPEQLASTSALGALGLSAAAGLTLLLWLILGAPGYLGYGSSLLWAGAPRSNGPLYDLVVHPGNRTVRRRSDQLVTADLVGFSSDKVTLFARYKGATKWEQTSMQPQRSGNGYEFLFAGLSDPVDYYVSAGRMQSKNFRIDVKDMPTVQHMRVTVHYPQYLALKDQVTEPGGDVRAVEGSRAEIAVQTDKPLSDGMLVMEDGRKLKLSQGDGNWLTAQLPVQKDGSYHVAAMDNGDAIRLTDDYFIEARKDAAPTVKIVNPARDPHVSPIEELPVAVETTDDFGLSNVSLHYSINGGPEKTIPLSPKKGQKDVQGTATLSFEEFKAAPGDIVSFYATASDAKTTSRTDMLFAQAEPFDLRFKQSQQSGGGGGGAGNENDEISQRQKEIIAATWNEVRNGATDKNAAAEEAKFLSDVEGKLGAQAKTLADRMRSRELAGNNAEFDEFSKQMDRAAAEMGSAVGQLKGRSWTEALQPEQRALQALTRAESVFKDIQIAFNRMNGGSGGGAGSAGRDLERMFDLELDTEKNQYETGETASSQSEQQKSMEDALERLKELARRQQDLAAQRQLQQSSQQRWEQEMLRREAEQLQREMQQMAKNGQRGQQSQSGQQSSSQSSGQSSSSRSTAQSRGGQSGQQSGQQSRAGMQASSQQLQAASDALQRAEDEMRSAVSRQDAGSQQRAAQQLQAAADQLRQLQQQQSGNSISDLAARSQQMLDRQKDFANRLRETASEQSNENAASNANAAANRRFGFGGRWNRDPYDPSRRSLPGQTGAKIDKLAQEKQQMADQLDRLQREVERQARTLSGDQPGVASKLRDAASTIQQQDLPSHMKKDADWIRQGYAAETWINEQGATSALDQFNRQIQQAQQMVQNGSPGQQRAGQGPGRPGGDVQQALQQLQQMRQQLANQARGQASPGGQAQNGTAQDGDPFQMLRQRAGGATPGGNPAIAEAMQNMAALRQQLGPRSGRAYYDSEYAYRFLQNLEGANPTEFSARLNREVLPAIQRLEVDLKQQASAQADAGRIAASEPAPDGYSDAVAEYFKKLSK